MVEVMQDTAASQDSEERSRQQAIRQAKARRLFRISTTASGVGVALLVPIWAATEYQHAGGWPTCGFSQRSGSPNAWNVWIIYPVIAWASMTAASGWAVYGRQQIPAGELGRETERRPGVRGVIDALAARNWPIAAVRQPARSGADHDEG